MLVGQDGRVGLGGIRRGEEGLLAQWEESTYPSAAEGGKSKNLAFEKSAHMGKAGSATEGFRSS